MKTKILRLLMGTVLSLSLLCACGKEEEKEPKERKRIEDEIKPTEAEVEEYEDKKNEEEKSEKSGDVQIDAEYDAEEILRHAFDDVKSLKMTADIDIKVTYIYDGAAGDETQPVEIAMTGQVTGEICQNAAHLYGDIKASYFGIEETERMDKWQDYENGFEYSYDKDTDCYIRSGGKKEPDPFGNLIGDDSIDYRKAKTRNVTSDQYIIEVPMTGNGSDMMDFFGNGTDDIVMTVYVGKDEGYLERVEMDIDLNNMDDAMITIDKFNFVMNYTDYNDVEVEIPEEVLQSVESYINDLDREYNGYDDEGAESRAIDISISIDNKKITFPMTNKDLDGLELNKNKQSSYYSWTTADESLEITTTAKSDDEPVSMLKAEFAYYNKFAFPYLRVESNGIVVSETAYDETLKKLGTPKNKYESATGEFRSLTYNDGKGNTVTFSFAKGDKCTGIEIYYNS